MTAIGFEAVIVFFMSLATEVLHPSCRTDVPGGIGQATRGIISGLH